MRMDDGNGAAPEKGAKHVRYLDFKYSSQAGSLPLQVHNLEYAMEILQYKNILLLVIFVGVK